MVILGLNYFFHDSTACLVVDGELRVALEEERFTRQKHTQAFPVQAVEQCLRQQGMDFHDIDHIAVSIKPGLDRGAKLAYGLRHPRQLKPFLRHEFLNSARRQRGFRAWLQRHWPDPACRPEVHYIEHHLAHIAGSFFVSPYERAALLSLDGAGEWATSWVGVGEGNRVKRLGGNYFPHSLGSVYEAATEFCGFRPNYDEGKTMGLAPFGDPRRFQPTVARIVVPDGDWGTRVDLSYFSYQHWGFQRCSPKFHRTFGPPRRGGAFAEHHQDVAAAFQRVLEDRVLAICRRLRERTGADYLVLAGGVSLNSVMNGRILREAGFKDLYVMPAAGDNGTAIGAAFYLYNGLLGLPRRYAHLDPYVGNAYSDEEIARVLRQAKLPARQHGDIVEVAADLLARGQIIGWHQGRMEIGPRALGNRSILANPTLPGMKDKINAEVKYREPYRPFAPAAPAERKSEYFDIEVDAPFMLKVCNVRPEARARLPAVTHVDGSARLQTVHRDSNPLFHRLLHAFEARSGTPVLLNTSFNIQGEPVVESPWHALRCFYSTGLDALVLGNFLLTKESLVQDPPSRLECLQSDRPAPIAAVSGMAGTTA
ncbi:carbamoyltransferase [Alkalilimnicola sp. S0819]|uniref:carbamoyltransferase family protein n=1 Tax=Alkalilimnicola sp. S0819 TaxID=2613922 RepID=UPI00126145B3|nr:carbamoyltransferase C-terminal domain-containing protein [Alkalilimnicola sp. S0819]KAB7627891.1 carbamoyltransferase [Alkalilimnicola sp. S0819]MPQ15527.1 carbamoyltransferase [Alkalilimnicola sp. S0819]